MLSEKNLKQLLVLIEKRNFNRAAEALNISQPALSRSVASLEQSLGVRFFDRDQKGLALTEFGEVIAERGPEALNAMAAIVSDVRKRASLELGVIRLGVDPNIKCVLLPQVLATFVERFPKIELRVINGTHHELMQKLLDGELDLYAGGTSATRVRDNVVRVNFPTVEPTYVVRQGHPLLELSVVTPRESMRYPTAFPTLTNKMWHRLNKIRIEHKLPLLPCLAIDSYETLVNIVERSDHVLGMPKFVFDHINRNDRLVELNFKDTAYPIHSGCVYRKDRTLTKAAYALIDAFTVLAAVKMKVKDDA